MSMFRLFGSLLLVLPFLIACGGGGGGGGSAPAPGLTQVNVSGKATFDRVRHNTDSSLNLGSPVISPIRGAVVELLGAGDALIASSETDASGNYLFSNIPANTTVRVRVKAQMLRTGAPAWNFRVVDNTNGGALYSIASSSLNVGGSHQTLNLHAAVGTGTTYQTVRAAAPFAILDSAYAAYNKVLVARPTLAFQPLDINWSVNNVAAPGNVAIGEIGTSNFNGTAIYILGKADNDTDEFDDHVVIHEWGHYFEGFHSRSDSIGGQHGGGDKLDIRVAFGEGFGNAWSGIVTDDPFYRDSLGLDSSQGFAINVETNVENRSPGWASESVVQSLLYDIYDSGTETGDSVALGITPVLDVLMGHQRQTTAFTSIFSFLTGLKAAGTGANDAIDLLVTARNITAAGIDDFASTEVIDGGDATVLPIYRGITPGLTVGSLCSVPTNGKYNKLGVNVFLKMTIATAGSYTISVPSVATDSDPDFYIYKTGELVSGSDGASSGDNETETWTGALQPGVYVIELHEYRNVDGGTTRTSCFSMTLN